MTKKYECYRCKKPMTYEEYDKEYECKQCLLKMKVRGHVNHMLTAQDEISFYIHSKLEKDEQFYGSHEWRDNEKKELLKFVYDLIDNI